MVSPHCPHYENKLFRRLREPNFFSASSNIFSFLTTSKGMVLDRRSISWSEGKSSKLMLLKPVLAEFWMVFDWKLRPPPAPRFSSWSCSSSSSSWDWYCNRWCFCLLPELRELVDPRAAALTFCTNAPLPFGWAFPAEPLQPDWTSPSWVSQG